MSPKWPRPRPAGPAGGVTGAIALHRAGRLDEAQRAYEAILAAAPDDVDALHFLGVLQHQRGDSARGIASIERALVLAPTYTDACNNLGNIYKDTGRLDAAARAYQRVVALAPGHADAWNNLGVVLRAQRQYEAAEQAYDRALAAHPAHVPAWQNRGNLLARQHRLDEAVAAYRQVLALRPGDALALESLGRAYYRAGRLAEATHVYAEWLTSDPGNAVARHMLAACTGDDAPARASDAYVRAVFDAFASSFDQVLDDLGYRAPTLIAEWLDRVRPGAAGAMTIADAGCGTGLCASFLRPQAGRLVGIDLSPGMLARARARGAYDTLVEGELAAVLAREHDAYDLIVSADTLCYFGALEPAMAAAAHALRPGGWVVFTVERAASDVPRYALTGSGRYGHAPAYVRDVLQAAGLALHEITEVTLRREAGHDVAGLLAGARRPA